MFVIEEGMKGFKKGKKLAKMGLKAQVSLLITVRPVDHWPSPVGCVRVRVRVCVKRAQITATCHCHFH